MTNWNLEVLVSVKRREKPLNYNKQAWNAVPIFNSVAESLRWDKVNASFDLLNLNFILRLRGHQQKKMNESFFRFVHLCLLSLASKKVSFRSLHLNRLLLMCWNSNPAYSNWRLLSSTCYIVQDAACLNHKREEKGRGNETGKMERGYCVILHLPPLCFIPI